MAFMDKLKFWKKNDDPFGGINDISINPNPGQPPGGPPGQPPANSFGQPAPADPFAPQGGQFGQPTQDPFAPQNNFQVQPVAGSTNFMGGAGGGTVEKDLEIISAKIDALKGTLEAINQRLQNIERIAHAEQQPQHGNKKQWY